MKKSSLLSLITLFLAVCFFFVPQIIYADKLPAITWIVNGSLDTSTYNPGDTITLSGTISSALCSNSMNPIDVGYTNYSESCAANKCSAFITPPLPDNSPLSDIYQRLNDMWAAIGMDTYTNLRNCMNTNCSPGNIKPSNGNNVMTLTGGGNTLEWQNKVTIPPDTPCGVYSIKLDWAQPIYSKGWAGLVGTVTGSKVFTIQVGQTGTCGSANNTTTTSSPNTSLLCSSGRASNVFSIGNNWKWTCDTFDKCGSDTRCQASKTAVAGACGTNAQPNPKTYSAPATTFFGTFCLNNVISIPEHPAFPTTTVPSKWYCGTTECNATFAGSGCP